MIHYSTNYVFLWHLFTYHLCFPWIGVSKCHVKHTVLSDLWKEIHTQEVKQFMCLCGSSTHSNLVALTQKLISPTERCSSCVTLGVAPHLGSLLSHITEIHEDFHGQVVGHSNWHLSVCRTRKRMVP